MIFVSKKNIYFPQPFNGPKFQRGMLHPVGFWHPLGAALDTTITVGNRQYDVSPDPTSPQPCFIYGYDGGVDYFNGATFGSIASATYTDGGSNSRTVSAMYWAQATCTGGSTDDSLYFCLNAASISNSDTTFVSIDYDGTNHLRSAATYTPTTGGCSAWEWNPTTPNPATSGTVNFLVNI